MKSFLDFLKQHKVLIIGFLLSMALPINDLIQRGEIGTMVLIWSAVLAGVTWLSRNLRGQWATISGIALTVLTTWYTKYEAQQQISYFQLLIQAFILYGAANMPPAKSRGYEHSDTIVRAKLEGEKKAPTTLNPELKDKNYP